VEEGEAVVTATSPEGLVSAYDLIDGCGVVINAKFPRIYWGGAD
jgi:hypothetical protein